MSNLQTYLPGESSPAGASKIRFKLTGLIMQFMKAARAGEILTHDGNRYKSRSVDGYKTLLLHIEDYEKEIGVVMLDHITPAWAIHFTAFLTRKGLSKNTIATILAKLKSIIKRSHMAGLTHYTGMGIRTPKEATTAIYNSLTELKALYQYDLSERPAQERVRDMYIFNCFTGMRISDLRVFCANPKKFIRDIDGVKYIDYVSQKTNTQSVIPLSQVSLEILEKRDYDFGRVAAYQVFNKIIKSVAEKSGITENVILTRTEGGVRKELVVRKCQMMSSHTARRTFATLAELSDLPRNSIMQMTGHSSEDSYLKYVRNTASQNAVRIRDHAFFQITLSE